MIWNPVNQRYYHPNFTCKESEVAEGPPDITRYLKPTVTGEKVEIVRRVWEGSRVGWRPRGTGMGGADCGRRGDPRAQIPEQTWVSLLRCDVLSWAQALNPSPSASSGCICPGFCLQQKARGSTCRLPLLESEGCTRHYTVAMCMLCSQERKTGCE